MKEKGVHCVSSAEVSKDIHTVHVLFSDKHMKFPNLARLCLAV